MKLLVNSAEDCEATTPVGWCLEPEDFTKLERYPDADPETNCWLVLATFAGGRETMTRRVVRISDGLVYLPFRRAGENTIHAFLVIGKREDVFNTVLSRNSASSYRRGIFEYNGKVPDALGWIHLGWSEISRAQITVVVDSKFFAPEPTAGEKWWVNLWFEFPPIDQCAFRRRRILAYTLQPLIVTISWMLTTAVGLICAVLLVSLGCWREWRFERKATIPWWDADMKKESVVIFRPDGRRRSAFFWPWLPLVPLVLTVLFHSVKPEIRGLIGLPLQIDWPTSLLWALVVTAGLSVIFGLVDSTITLVKSLWRRIKRLWWWVRNTAAKRRWQVVGSTYEPTAETVAKPTEIIRVEKPTVDLTSLLSLTCNGPREIGFEYLVPDRTKRMPRTVYLKLAFQALKARVCRPYPS